MADPPEPPAIERHTLTLVFRGIRVGVMTDAFAYDIDTWFGFLTLSDDILPTPIGRRLTEYFAFCEEWNARSARSPAGADPAEFDRFADVLSEGTWLAESEGGSEQLVIDVAPMPVGDGEFSFRTRL